MQVGPASERASEQPSGNGADLVEWIDRSHVTRTTRWALRLLAAGSFQGTAAVDLDALHPL